VRYLFFRFKKSCAKNHTFDTASPDSGYDAITSNISQKNFTKFTKLKIFIMGKPQNRWFIFWYAQQGRNLTGVS